MDGNSGVQKKFSSSPRLTAPFSQEQLDFIQRKREEWVERQYEYYDFADHNTVAYDLKKGEIYEVDWGMNINAEFSGRHYGVVLVDSPSNNPLVMMCPLKTHHKNRINYKSDFYVGEIKGLPINVKTVAVLNQARMLDKLRIYTQLAIGPNHTNLKLEQNSGIDLPIVRLDERKLNKIVTGVARIAFGLDPYDRSDVSSEVDD